MALDSIKRVAVIGSGTMGNGIAQVLTINGYDVDLVDIKQEFLDRAVATIGKSFDRMIKKERITEKDKEAALSHLRTSTEIAAAADAGLVFEAVRAGHDICVQYLFIANNTAGIGHQETGQVYRYAFYEPGTDDEAD